MAKHMTRRDRRWHVRPKMTARELREERWRKQCFGVLRFLGELKISPELGGAKWKSGMFTYYGNKARDLLENPPPGMEAEVIDFRRKLDRCKIPSAER